MTRGDAGRKYPARLLDELMAASSQSKYQAKIARICFTTKCGTVTAGKCPPSLSRAKYVTFADLSTHSRGYLIVSQYHEVPQSELTT
jgi:hypothetical protein